MGRQAVGQLIPTCAFCLAVLPRIQRPSGHDIQYITSQAPEKMKFGILERQGGRFFG